MFSIPQIFGFLFYSPPKDTIHAILLRWRCGAKCREARRRDLVWQEAAAAPGRPGYFALVLAGTIPLSRPVLPALCLSPLECAPRLRLDCCLRLVRCLVAGRSSTSEKVALSSKIPLLTHLGVEGRKTTLHSSELYLPAAPADMPPRRA